MKQEKKQKRVQPTGKKIEESLSYTVEVRDKEGRIIKCISAPSRSYVEQWNQLVNVQAGQANKTVKDTDGVDRSVVPYGYNLGAVSGIGDIVRGIRVGKGTTAVAITDYALKTPCGEGTGTDQFNHQAMVFTEPAVVASTCSFTLRRVMINNSGSTITGIKEIGCHVSLRTPTLYGALGFRDVLPSAVYVPHGGSITVTYTIKVTV